jgi:ribosome-binding protein aMBF1 (putative translation factor)
VASTTGREGSCTSGQKLDDLHQERLKRPAYKAEYEALGAEFAVASALIEARARAGLSQAQVADRMQTTQTVIAQLESGRGKPATRTP